MGAFPNQPNSNEQSRRAASGIVDGRVGRRLDQLRYELCDLLGRVELASTLALPLGELAEQVLVGATKDIRFGVLQPEAMLAQDLKQRGQSVIVERALAALCFVEVLGVEYAV